MSESPLLEAALRYAASGVAVFPSRLYVRGDGRKGVNPISDWDEASSTDPEVIRGWFTGAWRDAALCIDCGKSGIAGVDQDVTEGKNGIAEWDALEHEPTWSVRSPTGGKHDYYRADPEHPFTVDNTGAVADGVDIRGMGGFLFAPPSIDPRGGMWQWEGEEPDWTALPLVPEVVIKRMEQAAERKRKKAPVPALASAANTVDTPTYAGTQLFASPSELGDFGPGAGRKKASAASALLTEELRKFTELTEQGSGRSHILAQKLGVLAGHGVGVFWTYEGALETLMTACAANGFSLANGEAYAQQQAERGLEYGMREPWIRQEEDVTPADVAAAFGASGSAPVALPTSPEQAQSMVDALLAELLTPDQLGAKEAPRALVKGLLNLDSEAWIIGAPGSKKSFVVLDLAAHIALGRPWQGLRVHQGLVVMIVAEGAGGMSTRVKAWQQENGPISDQLLVLPRPVQAADIAAWQVLVEACRRLEPVMVVIDTQARVTVGMEENAAKDMGVYIEAVRRVREATGACVLTVHHTGRNGGDARGSSAIDGAQGTELKVVRQDAMTGVLKIEKQKDLEERPEVPLYFRRVVVGVDEDGDEITSLVMTEGNAFKDAAGAARIDPADEWEAPVESVRELALRVLADHGEERGVTSSQAHKIVIERWYGRDKSRLKEATWRTSWNRAIKDESVLNVGGERYTIDPLVGQ